MSGRRALEIKRRNARRRKARAARLARLSGWLGFLPIRQRIRLSVGLRPFSRSAIRAIMATQRVVVAVLT